MKNAYAANSMCSLKSGLGDSNYFSRSNRSIGPILATDFESRLMLNSRMPQKKSISQHIRKNDFIVALDDNYNNSRQQNILMNCFDNDDSEIDEINQINFKTNKSKNEDTKNDSIKSLVFESFKAFNLTCTNEANGANSKKSITKTTSQQNFCEPLNKENVNYIKPWVESSCNKYFSSNSLVFAKNTTSLKLNMNNLSLSNTNSKENTNHSNDSFIIKNIEYNNQKEKEENYIRLNELNSNCSVHMDDVDQKSSLLVLPSNHNMPKPKRTITMVDLDVKHIIPKPPVFTKSQNIKKSSKIRYWQCKIYNYLERPRGWKAIIYHAFVFLTVLFCLILSVLVTIPNYEIIASEALVYTEGLIVTWLTIELSLRVWSAGCRSRYQSWKGRLKFMKNIFCILDLTVIIATVVLICIANTQKKHTNFAAAAFRGLRFFQILRMLRVDRRAGTWRLLGTVVWAHRQELITTFYIGFLSLIVSSFIMYLIEKDEEASRIKTFADSLWWGVITLCTIGYGDVYPVTAPGKLLASCCALIGISFFALPAGILGSGFALKVQAMQRQKHLNRRRAPAATLIQCLWRCYASNPDFKSSSIWKPYIKALAANSFHLKRSTLSPGSPGQMTKHGSTYSIFNRFSSLKKNSPSADETSNKGYIKTNSLIQPLFDNQPSTKQTDSNMILNLFNANTSIYTNDNETQVIFTKDINEKGSISNILPKNLKTVKSKGLESQNIKVTPIKSSFAHRTLNFLNESMYSSSVIKSSDSEEKNLNKLEYCLTLQHKYAIRALYKLKYFVARRKFKEALRPYDVTDVIEQYSSGNTDMLNRIKILQFRLDKILGSSKSKDCYDSNNKPLSYRIIKVEKQMNNIDSKLDKFIINYSNDMKSLLDKLSILSTNTTKYDPSYINESDYDYPRVSPLLVKSNSNPMDSTYHLRNFNTKKINDYKELASDKAISLNENKSTLSFQDTDSFRMAVLNKLKAKRLKQLGVRALSYSFEKEKKLNILASETSRDEIEFIDSEIDYDNDDEIYLYSYENDNHIDENREVSYEIINGPPISMAKRILNNQDSESTPSPKRSKTYKRPTKFSMKQYLLNTIQQNKTNFHCIDKYLRKYKSDSELSFYSGSGFNNIISVRKKINFFRNANMNENKITNLLNQTTKSDIIIKNDDIMIKMNNDFKALLKRKNSENLRSNTPRIFISKPDEICNDNSNSL